MKPLLCYVTDRRSLQPASETQIALAPILEKIETIAAAGVDWIQIREKDLTAKACASLAHETLARLAKLANRNEFKTRVILNDRLDVALAERAAGVQLGENSLPVQDANRLVRARHRARELPNEFLIGVSCHSFEAAKAAAEAGANYIFFGPVFATPSKASYGAPQGLEHLAAVCRFVTIPVLAIGGITLSNAASCLTAGASGIAAIRLFQNAADPAQIVRALRDLGP
jgi:thiamine-phosphate pyrophosphorylase